jgi:putative methionine-R-sulfoxide reductase with GAF domain
MKASEVVLSEIQGAFRRGRGRTPRARAVAGAIRRGGKYRWVGLYDVGVDEISVLAWSGSGPPTHPRFPRSQGLCGAAVAVGETVIVDDATTDPRYLTTFGSTRSEMVVPVMADGAVLGLIDVESERPAEFSAADRVLLERCAAAIVPFWRPQGDD